MTNEIKLLIVEDERDTLDDYCMVLAEEDRQIMRAMKVSDALSLIRQHTFQVIVADLAMPVAGDDEALGGLEVLKTAKECNPSTRVIVVTGYKSAIARDDSMQLGAYDHIYKPVNLKHLRMTVNRAIQDFHLAEKRRQREPECLFRICPLTRAKGCDKYEEIIDAYAPNRVFVNIPYVEQYEDCEHAIREVLLEYGLVPVLSKDYVEPKTLLCNVCHPLQTCKYGITDISRQNPGVFYELGIMHALGMHCVILKKKRAKEPADLHGLLHLEYASVRSLKEQLARWIEQQVPEAVNTSRSLTREELRQDREQTIKERLAQHRRNLAKLQQKLAKYTELDAPVYLLNQIEDEEQEIARLENQLTQRQS